MTKISMKEFQEKGIEVKKSKDILIWFFKENKEYAHTLNGIYSELEEIIPFSTIWYALHKLIKDEVIKKRLLYGKVFYGMKKEASKSLFIGELAT